MTGVSGTLNQLAIRDNNCASKGMTIISDPGVDDIVALVLLEKLAAERRKVLVSTFGNAPAKATGQNARNFIAYIQGTWEYRPGAELPLGKQVGIAWPDYYHGSDGVWGIGFPPPKGPVRTTGGPLPVDCIVSLGPMTDTYRLLQQGKTKQICIMGGAFEVYGNETTRAEFNMAMDADAARLFFEKCEDINVKVVPMDAALQVFWTRKDIQKIPESSPMNLWLKKLLLAWFDNYAYADAKNFVLYDPLTIYLLFDPQAAVWKRSGITVINEGAQRGRTLLSELNPPCDIALSIINPREVALRIFSILFEEETNDDY